MTLVRSGLDIKTSPQVDSKVKLNLVNPPIAEPRPDLELQRCSYLVTWMSLFGPIVGLQLSLIKTQSN